MVQKEKQVGDVKGVERMVQGVKEILSHFKISITQKQMVLSPKKNSIMDEVLLLQRDSFYMLEGIYASFFANLTNFED